MSSTDNRQRVRAAFEAVGRGDPSAFVALMADEVTYTLIGSTAMSGTFRGREELMRRLLGPLIAAMATPLQFEIESLMSEGDRVVVQACSHATLRSGAPYANTYCFVFRFAGAQAVEVTEYLDTALITRAVGVPADRAELLRRMDLNMWEMFREVTRQSRGGELFETAPFWMAFNPRGTEFHNMDAVRDAVDAEALCAAIRAFYGPRQRPFSVWLRAHGDAALEAALRARGFSDFLRMPGMALLGDPGTRCDAAGLTIRAATSEAQRRDYLHVSAEAYATYGAPRKCAEDAFAALASVCAPHIQGFVGYVEGAPVAAAVYVTHGVAGIGWVGTVPEYRGRGFGEAVTWAAIREGFRRGGAFANLQASPMGRPIYERMGFVTPTEYRVLVGTV